MSVQRIPPPFHMASTANADPDRVNTATSETLDWPGATFAAGDVGVILASSGGTEVTVSGGGGGWEEVDRAEVVGANAHAVFAFACRVDQATLDANGGVMPAPTISVAAGGFPIVLAYMFHLRGARGTTVADCVRTWAGTQASGTGVTFGPVDLLADSYCLFLYGAGTNGQQLGGVDAVMAGFYNPLHLFSHATGTGDDANINISRAIFAGPGDTGVIAAHTATANTARAKILVAIAPPQEDDLGAGYIFIQEPF